MSPEPVVLVGRSTSHFTRVATCFASELGVPWTLSPVPRLLGHQRADFGGHPALKIPTMHLGGEVIFGAENICWRLTKIAGRSGDSTVVLPQDVSDSTARNAQEIVWVAMGSQVQLRLAPAHTANTAEPAHIAKTRVGLEGALDWLDAHLDRALFGLPAPREVSVFEVSLLCLVDHLAAFPTVPLAPVARLRAFAASYGRRPAARLTAFPATSSAGAPMKPLVPPALDPATLPPRTGSGYPAPFLDRVLPREKRALGDALGLTRFGVNLTTLYPGRESALRHHHAREDELIYVLEGEVFLRTDQGEQRLIAGMCAGFPAGAGDAHQLVNRSDAPARYLEVGSRDPADEVVYPDDDLAAHKNAAGTWTFTHRDGSAY